MASSNAPHIDYSLLKGRSAIVTGGASGLGAATATKFAEHGAYVTIADMQERAGQTLAQVLCEKGFKATYVHCDTTNWASSVAAFKHAVSFSPAKTLDIVVLFAGIDGEKIGLVDAVIRDAGEPSLDQDPAEPPYRALEVNLIGVYQNTYLALHYFRLSPSAGDGSPTTFKKSLVLVSSMTGYVDLPYNTGYAVSKYGVRGLFRSIRSQAHRLNVRTNNIAPAYVLTPLTMKVHGITSPDEPSKATGVKLPWAPIGHVVDAACHCAINERTDGSTFLVVPSGFHDIEEDFETGYGGERFVKLMEQDGFMSVSGLFPSRRGGS